MKAKTKTNSKRGKTRSISYPAYYLALALGLVILLEGFMMGVATPKSVSEGLSVLDMSGSVHQVVSDFSAVIAPMMDQVASITKFYQLAAAELTTMLDMSNSNLLMFPKGVIEFYNLASVQMAELLDFSGQYTNMPQVAGISIFR